jgi:4-amino-4-deoxy-L-arabinose transferase-like glycosyltransferase
MDRRWILLLLGVTALAAGLRLAALEAARPLRLVGDESYYVQVASHLAHGRGHLYVGGFEGPSRAWRPPAHAWLLSLAVSVGAQEPADPTRDQALLLRLARLELALGVALVALTGCFGRALFGARTGLVAAALCALYPALVVHSHYLWSETFFALLVTAALWALVEARARRGLALPLAAGLLFGAATLTREVSLVVAGAGAAWWLSLAPAARRRPELARAACMLALACAVVAPWTLRNAQVLGRFVPVSHVGWFALAEGNSLESPRWLEPSGPVQGAFHAHYFSTRDEAARIDVARRHARARIAAEQPLWLAKKVVRNGALLLNPDSVLRTKIRRGSYGDRPPALVRGLLAASVPAWMALATLAVLGVAGAEAQGRRRLACLVLAGVALLHVVSNATPRFRVPWIPLLAVYASHALLTLPSLPARTGWAARIAALVCLLFLFGVALPYFLHFGGRP